MGLCRKRTLEHSRERLLNTGGLRFRFAALSLALAWAIPLLSVAQTATAPTFAPLRMTKPELALLPDAPFPATPAAVAVTISSRPVPCSREASGERKSGAVVPGFPCDTSGNRYVPFLDSTAPAPLTPAQKGVLAVRNFEDPGNLVWIVYMSAMTIGMDAHTAYGPGWKGFGENVGYRTVRDGTGEFVGTFLIPSLTHQDPRYHRMPNASVPRRILHAVSHTIIAESDDGGRMPNYGVLVGTPIRAEIANLYVPGVQCNLPGTARRVANSFAMDPANDLITEFLPDVARHVHIHARFVEHMLADASGMR